MGSELNKSPSLGVTIGWIELKVECSFNELFFGYSNARSSLYLLFWLG